MSSSVSANSTVTQAQYEHYDVDEYTMYMYRPLFKNV